MKRILYPLSAAFIWGMAFAFQRSVTGSIGAFTFNVCRSALAVPCLGLLLFARRRIDPVVSEPGGWRPLIAGSLYTGVLLFGAANLQQIGLAGTEAGKAGFLTALYTVLVPVFGVLFFRKKVSPSLWVSVVIAAVGMWFICIKAGFALVGSDVLEILCAVLFAFYILAADHYVKTVNPVALSCGHFIVSGVLSLLAALLFESIDFSVLWENRVALVYVGVLSSAVGYTLEFFSHRLGNPVAVSLLLSLESVFSVVGGAVILGEYLSARELFGCGVMFCAVILAQLPEDWFRKKKETA